MKTAHLDSDRLVVLAAAPESGVPSEKEHLASCAECRLELRLLGAARRLGTAQVASVDSDRLVTAVRARLAQPDPPRRHLGIRASMLWTAGLAAAAAVALVVRFTVLPGPGAPPNPPAVAAVTVLHELDDLSAPELETVLSTLPSATEAMPHLDAVSLTDLEVRDLERVLRSMEE